MAMTARSRRAAFHSFRPAWYSLAAWILLFATVTGRITSALPASFPPTFARTVTARDPVPFRVTEAVSHDAWPIVPGPVADHSQVTAFAGETKALNSAVCPSIHSSLGG